MIATNFGDTDIYLLNEEPNWDSGVQGEFSVLSDTTVSLTNREGRRPLAASLRVNKLSYTATLDAYPARALAFALRAYQTQPIVVPLWPATVRWAERAGAAIQSGYAVVWKPDWSQWEIITWDELPGWPAADDLIAPALWGRLDKRAMDLLKGDAVEFHVEFVEASPIEWALAPAAVAWAAGPQPGTGWSANPKVMPFDINFEGPTQTFDVRIVREQIGFTRAPAETLYPQANVRKQDSPYVATDAGAALLRFFLDFGSGGAFWASQWSQAVALTADVGAMDTVLHVDDSSTLRVGDFLAFAPGDGNGPTCGRVTALGAGTITLAAAVGAFKRGTLVAQLVLCRFASTTLSITWSNTSVALATLSLTELGAEYTIPGDETRGTTISLLPTRAWLYEFSRVLNGVTVTSRYTSYERSLSSGGYVFQDMTHGDIKSGLYLDADQVEITTFLFAGNPLLDLATMRMEAPLFVTIKTADVAGTVLSNTQTIFYGEVVTATVSGSKVIGTAMPGGSVFDRHVPRVRFQTVCNNSLFDVGCGLAQGDWVWTCFIHADEAQGNLSIQIDTLASANGATLVANFFAMGWFEVLGADGGPWQMRPVLTSSAPAAGVITIGIDRNFYPLVKAGDGCIIMPGCDLSASTCRSKFNNYLNFLGHPFMPVGNPSLVKSTTNSTGGGKK